MSVTKVSHSRHKSSPRHVTVDMESQRSAKMTEPNRKNRKTVSSSSSSIRFVVQLAWHRSIDRRTQTNARQSGAQPCFVKWDVMGTHLTRWATAVKRVRDTCHCIYLCCFFQSLLFTDGNPVMGHRSNGVRPWHDDFSLLTIFLFWSSGLDNDCMVRSLRWLMRLYVVDDVVRNK